jgi:deoxyribonuclease IV
LDLSLERARDIGAQCTQFFISPPQQWAQSNHDEEEIAKYLVKVQETEIGPNFIHGTYLVNLATDKSEHLQKSIDWLIYALKMADKLQVTGVIFHTGSHRGRGFAAVKEQVCQSIKTILKSSPEKPFLILENAAGSGGVIGSFEELGEILKQVADNRLKICLDTQHAFSNGNDFRSLHGVDSLVSTIDRWAGWGNLVAIHCNDSKVELGSNRDRHENIGEGFIGKEAFSLLLNHPKFTDIPFLLEVPGFGESGPDKENVAILKSLITNP